MKIKSLDIFGYGRWVNQRFSVDESIQLFYGPNESGKSTLQSFIRSILFGFPSKRKRVRQTNRYEPKNSDAYGGRILLTDTVLGEVWVERVDKTLRLYTSEGLELAPTDLDKILGGLDETLFDNFYAFNLTNLQELANIGVDQLNDYFLGIGTMGSDKFLRIAKEFDKGAEELFKKKGSKPKLNQMLDNLALTTEQLSKAQVNASRYNQLIESQKKMDNEIQLMRDEISKVEENLRSKDKLLARYEVYLRLKSAKRELQGLVYTQIDEQAPEVVKDNLTTIQKMEEELIVLSERLGHLQLELGELTRYHWAINHEEQRQEWLKQTEQVKETQALLEQLHQRIQEANEHLNQIALKGQFYPEKVANSSTYRQQLEEGLAIQGEVADLSQDIDRIRIERKVLLDQRKNLQNRSANLRQKVAKIEAQRVNDEEILIQNTRLTHYFLPFLLFGVGLIASVVNLLSTESGSVLLIWLSVIASMIGLIWGVWIFMGHRKLIQSYNNDPLLDKVKEFKEEERRVYEESQNLGIEINTLEEAIEQLNQELSERLTQQRRWLTQIGFYPTADPQWVLKADPVSQYFTQIEKREQLENEFALLSDKIANWKSIVSPLLERFPAKDESTRVLIRHVEEIEASLNESQRRGKSIEQRIQETKDQSLKNRREIEHLQSQIQEIFEATSVESKGEFDERIAINAKIRELKTQVVLYEEQVEGYQEELEGIDSKQQLIDQIDAYQRQLERLKEMLDPLITQRANLQVESQQLEKDGTASRLSQQLESQKAEAMEIIRLWAVKRTASEIINQTLRKGIDNPVNAMNKIADQIFQTLSYNRYTQIKMNKTSIKVKQFSDVLFAPHELSQGTLEQLYVTLRLAFIMSAQTMIKMPIIIDDAFVNFDEFRKSSMYKVLKDISEDIQILFFTFDQQARETFSNEHIIELNEVNVVELPGAQ